MLDSCLWVPMETRRMEVNVETRRMEMNMEIRDQKSKPLEPKLQESMNFPM